MCLQITVYPDERIRVKHVCITMRLIRRSFESSRIVFTKKVDRVFRVHVTRYSGNQSARIRAFKYVHVLETAVIAPVSQSIFYDVKLYRLCNCSPLPVVHNKIQRKLREPTAMRDLDAAGSSTNNKFSRYISSWKFHCSLFGQRVLNNRFVIFSDNATVLVIASC